MKKWNCLLGLMLLLVGGSAQQKPNVVLILADDLGYGDLGCYGQQQIQTPSVDHLAASGMRFTQFYAGTAVCAPSRASLLTGLHTGHTPVRGNFEVQPEGQYPLPDSTFTLAELFRRAGYTTGLFGKWGLGYPGSEGEPLRQGFDEFYGYNCQRESHNYFPGHLWDNHQKVLLSNTAEHQQQYAPDLIQARALEFIDRHREQPFFLYLAYTLPHAGLQLPAGDSDLEAYREKFRELPRAVPPTWNGSGYQPQAFPHATYAAMVTRLDRYVGEVVAHLSALGLANNTLILFTSDNGPHREGGHEPEYFSGSGGLRGVKRDLYEGGIRVPMIACWPGRITEGTQSSYAGAFWDLLPTLGELTGQRPPVRTDGLSLLPVLTGQGRQRKHKFLYWEFHEEGGRQAVRMGRWKGVRLQVSRDPQAPVQLFDLEKDPGEVNDVSAAHPALRRKMGRIMSRQHTEHPQFPLFRTAGKR